MSEKQNEYSTGIVPYGSVSGKKRLLPYAVLVVNKIQNYKKKFKYV